MQLVGRRLGDRRVRAAVAVVPPLRRRARGPPATRVRTRPRPRSWATCADLRLVVGVERVVAEGVRRHQPRVVVVDGQQVARATGRRAGSARGRAPTAGRRSRRRRGSSTTSSTVTVFWRDARATVTDQCQPTYPGRVAGEEVGDDALALDDVAEVLADVGGVDLLEQRGAGQVDRRDGGGVGLGAHGRHHGRNHDPSAPALSGRVPTPAPMSRLRGVAASGQDGPMSTPRPDSSTGEQRADRRPDRATGGRGPSGGSGAARAGRPAAGAGCAAPPGRRAARGATRSARPGGPHAPRAPATPGSPG